MKEMTHKPLPLGIENFEQMIRSGFYYVDKTAMIGELLDKHAYVNLFTRPRRFGKSLNMSMLQHYLDILMENQQDLFQHLKISDFAERYQKHQNAYPVIKLTLKGAEGNDFKSAMSLMLLAIQNEYKRHAYLLESPTMARHEADYFNKINEGKVEADFHDLKNSLKFLSDKLKDHYEKKVIILIDEYDVPLEKAYFNGYYDEMVQFLRSFFNLALKTSDSLNFAVITGCLRVSKESIFTGINNFKVLNITSNVYGEYFGFTEPEVEEALAHYGLTHKKEVVREWYNGYLFGEETVYNPWSTINYLFDTVEGRKKYPAKEWANSSSNQIVRELIELADEEVRHDIETLIQGGTVIQPLREEIIYGEIKKNPVNLWNFLFFTGYLKKVSERFENGHSMVEMAIPNAEVLYIYETQIREWFEERLSTEDFTSLYNGLLAGEGAIVQEEIGNQLAESISFMDSAENFYHAFLLGILKPLKGYRKKSNRESGNGRGDIFQVPLNPTKPAVVIKVKTSKKADEMAADCTRAMAQINDRNYVNELLEEGYEHIMKVGITFYLKRCKVLIERE